MSHVDKTGRIEVITGCMFSGKTEELVRLLQIARADRRPVGVFKPRVDTRNVGSHVISHNGSSFPAVAVAEPIEILHLAKNCVVVGIDEAQFFSNELVPICRTLADTGTRIIVAGLDMDFMGRPFGPMPLLMAIAEQITKLKATCNVCGRPASYSHRLTEIMDPILIGAGDTYEPRCRKCFLRGHSEHVGNKV